MSTTPFDKRALAKGILILDENLSELAPELQKRNFRVYAIPAGMKDEEIVRLGVLPHKPLVTANTQDFIHGLEDYEFSIIDCFNVGSLEMTLLAKMISDAWRDFQLGSKRQFLNTLHRDGKHELFE